RRRHTRLQGDWSSDVCSSDLPGIGTIGRPACGRLGETPEGGTRMKDPVRSAYLALWGPDDGGTSERGSVSLRMVLFAVFAAAFRSEERRVGKECRARLSTADE